MSSFRVPGKRAVRKSVVATTLNTSRWRRARLARLQPSNRWSWTPCLDLTRRRRRARARRVARLSLRRVRRGRGRRPSRCRRVASINLCADQLVLTLADPEQILTVSWLAADPEESLLAEAARATR